MKLIFRVLFFPALILDGLCFTFLSGPQYAFSCGEIAFFDLPAVTAFHFLLSLGSCTL